MSETFAEILAAGGASNSLGRSAEVIARVLDDQDLFRELYDCVFVDDAWIRMRAIDAVEKVARHHPEWIGAYVGRIQTDLAASSQPSIQWHVAQIYGQVSLTSDQKRVAIDWLTMLLSQRDVDWIVAASAMKTLVQFTKDGSVPVETTVALLERQRAHRSRSVVRKANLLLESLTD